MRALTALSGSVRALSLPALSPKQPKWRSKTRGRERAEGCARPGTGGDFERPWECDRARNQQGEIQPKPAESATLCEENQSTVSKAWRPWVSSGVVRMELGLGQTITPTSRQRGTGARKEPAPSEARQQQQHRTQHTGVSSAWHWGGLSQGPHRGLGTAASDRQKRKEPVRPRSIRK